MTAAIANWLALLFIGIAIVLAGSGALYRYYSVHAFRDMAAWNTAVSRGCEPHDQGATLEPYVKCPFWVAP